MTDNPSCRVNVEFLTIYFCAEYKGNPMYDSGWLITENVVIRK